MDETLRKRIEEQFIGKYIVLTQQNGFSIDGEITEICGDFILFKTGIASSLISVNDIKRIVPKQRPEPPLFDKEWRL